jgi:hypothetical protein
VYSKKIVEMCKPFYSENCDCIAPYSALSFEVFTLTQQFFFFTEINPAFIEST